jgi:hypothetical protein
MVAILTNPLRYTVTTFPKSRQMAARYRYLVSRFADPSDAPAPAPVNGEQPGAETRQPDPEPAGAAPPGSAPPTAEPAGSPGAGAGQP